MPLDLLSAQVAVLKSQLEDQRKRHDEFMLRTDQRLEVLITQSNEWAGVRKAIWAGLTIVGFIGGFLGWVFHEIFPNGWHSGA